MGIDSIREIDLAETILKQNGCRIQSFIASSEVQYVIKKKGMNISPSFLSIRDICGWVVANHMFIEQYWVTIRQEILFSWRLILRGVVLLPVKKPATIAERLSKFERDIVKLQQIVKKQDQRIQELEREVKRLDLDEITEMGEKLNKSNQLRGK